MVNNYQFEKHMHFVITDLMRFFGSCRQQRIAPSIFFLIGCSKTDNQTVANTDD